MMNARLPTKGGLTSGSTEASLSALLPKKSKRLIASADASPIAVEQAVTNDAMKRLRPRYGRDRPSISAVFSQELEGQEAVEADSRDRRQREVEKQKRQRPVCGLHPRARSFPRALGPLRENRVAGRRRSPGSLSGIARRSSCRRCPRATPRRPARPRRSWSSP